MADAEYLRSAIRNIEYLGRGEKLWGSNLTATVIKLLNDSADALLSPSQPAEGVAELTSDTYNKLMDFLIERGGREGLLLAGEVGAQIGAGAQRRAALTNEGKD